MKVFLTSSANMVMDKIVPMLPKKPADTKVLFVPTAGDPYGENQPWMVADRNKLKELGFIITEFDLKNKSEEEAERAIDDSDIIFIGGGNTFYLLEKMQKSGFNKVIEKYKVSDKIYIGSSAGSCVAGPDLEPIAPVDDPDKADLDSTKALGLVDFVALPHHGREKYDAVHEKIIEEFGERYEIKTLTDTEFIFSDSN